MVTDIFGLLGMLTVVFSSCGFVESAVIKMCGLIFLLCTLFSGLTLLILRSNICTETGFFDYLFSLGNATYVEIESVNCTLSTGSNLAVTATVLWFVATTLCLMVPPMKPVGSSEEQEQATE